MDNRHVVDREMLEKYAGDGQICDEINGYFTGIDTSARNRLSSTYMENGLDAFKSELIGDFDEFSWGTYEDLIDIFNAELDYEIITNPFGEEQEIVNKIECNLLKLQKQ